MATTRNRSRSTKSSSAKRNQSLAARTGRTVRDRPYASAAIAAGAVAATLGAMFLSRRDKTLRQSADDAGALIKDGLAEARSRFKSVSDRLSQEPAKPQSEIAEEAMTLKQTGKKSRKPVDPVVEDQTRAGAIAY